MDQAFVRQEMLLGADAMARLRNAHVAVFGIGGVGSYSSEALARAGIGRLTLIDCDTVSESNLNRQLCALRSTIGQPKAEVMAARIRDINPGCQVAAVVGMYTDADKERFFADYDYIVDAIDLVSCKLSLIETALQRGIPIISAMGTGNKVDPSQFRIEDISKTQFCPLARIVRHELRARGILHHTVLWSPEPARTPVSDEAPPPGRRAIPGSLSWVPSAAGLMLAGHVVMALAEGGQPGERKSHGS